MPAIEPSAAAERAASPIPLNVAFATWLGAWIAGTVVLGALTAAAFGFNAGDVQTVPLMATMLAVSWATYLGAAWFASRAAGSGDPLADLGIAFSPIDLIAAPVGVVTQLVLIPLLYWPLRSLWPTTFSEDALGERSQEIVDQASGAMVVLLAALLVVGAPIVEEIVYRGMLQRSASRQLGPWGALIATSALFAVIHFSPVEIPGLFVAGVVFGLGVVVTGRIGPGVVAHMAFNATALIALLLG